MYGDDVKMQEKDKKSQKHEGRIQAGNTRGTGGGDPPIYRYNNL